jgi:hypothetical protein
MKTIKGCYCPFRKHVLIALPTCALIFFSVSTEGAFQDVNVSASNGGPLSLSLFNSNIGTLNSVSFTLDVQINRQASFYYPVGDASGPLEQVGFPGGPFEGTYYANGGGISGGFWGSTLGYLETIGEGQSTTVWSWGATSSPPETFNTPDQLNLFQKSGGGIMDINWYSYVMGSDDIVFGPNSHPN